MTKCNSFELGYEDFSGEHQETYKNGVNFKSTL